jgi:predicted transcriptional regulator
MGVYRWGMDMVPLTPERKAQLDDYAQRHGKDTAAALDDVLADALAWEREDYGETVDGIRRGYEDVKAGRTRPAVEFFAERSYE